MGWFKRKQKDELTPVFFQKGTWIDKNKDILGYCSFTILFNETTKKYVLQTEGLDPKVHTLYKEMFDVIIRLNEGTSFVEGGKIFNYIKNQPYYEKKNIEDLNEEECEICLKEALDHEEYEIAEKIKNQLNKLRNGK
jgi:hypothetical protein